MTWTNLYVELRALLTITNWGLWVTWTTRGHELRALDFMNSSQLWMIWTTLSHVLKVLATMNNSRMWMTWMNLGREHRWYDPHHKIDKLVDQEWLQDHLETNLYEIATCCLYGSKNLGIMKKPQSIMEGLINKSKKNATEIFPISSKSFKRTKENFLSQNYEWNMYYFSISWWLFKYKEVYKFGNYKIPKYSA